MRTKIAIVITRMDLGGAQQVALETAARLDPERFDVRLVAGAGGALDAEAATRLGARYLRIPSLRNPISPMYDLLALAAIVKSLHSWRPDIVHTHSSKAGMLGRVAAFLTRVPAVVHTAHGWSFHDRMTATARVFYISLERMLAVLTTRIAAVADASRLKGLRNGVGEESQYQILRAGVDLEAWSGTPRSRKALARALSGLLDQDVVVGCIANCKSQKNPLDFVRAAALVLQDAPRARFVYIGDGPLRAQAEALAGRLGVADRVCFLGWVREPRSLAAGFDVFLLTSLWEGLPCVFPQALSMGIPVVAYNVDGAPEIIEDDKNGYLVAAGDYEAAAARVAKLCRDVTLRARLSAAAARSVGPEFAYDAMVRQSAAMYESLVTNPRSTSR